MVQISEFLPNPVGSDTSGEWVELVNTGGSSVSIEGWRLANSSNKPKLLHGSIPSNSFLIIPRSATKLALKNNDETIFLYNPQGGLADQASFSGSAPEGQSFSRVGQEFIATTPTPGFANQTKLAASLISTTPYKFQTPINLTPSLSLIILAGLILGVICSVASLYYLKKSHDLSELFFSRN